MVMEWDHGGFDQGNAHGLPLCQPCADMTERFIRTSSSRECGGTSLELGRARCDSRCSATRLLGSLPPKRPLTEAAVTDEAEPRVDQTKAITTVHAGAERARDRRERMDRVLAWL